MSLTEGKCETFLTSASCMDADGQECSVHSEGRNSLMAALLYWERQGCAPCVVFVVKHGQVILEYFDLTQSILNVIANEDETWMTIEVKRAFRIQFQDARERKLMLDAMTEVNRKCEGRIHQVRILELKELQKEKISVAVRENIAARRKKQILPLSDVYVRKESLKTVERSFAMKSSSPNLFGKDRLPIITQEGDATSVTVSEDEYNGGGSDNLMQADESDDLPPTQLLSGSSSEDEAPVQEPRGAAACHYQQKSANEHTPDTVIWQND
eukprot:TRINITY_DN7937_c0_g1_i1.p1 TRINITY_DN7937_c0_g1~~TRINITY_DN7937_c0_g1_i1.p1  ORF type:complete len:269 (+),score=43.89 TRINITY_DN7937_c0_g1_i1:62-868(+)